MRRAVGVQAARSVSKPDLGFLSEHVSLERRTAWTDVAARPWRLHRASMFDRLTIHHAGNGVVTETDRNAVAFRLQNMQTAHLERNYGDLAYHFVIDYAGRVWEGRSLAYEGAHVAHHNENNIGIMVLGNFEKQTPSNPQFAGCDILVNLLRDRYRIRRHRIYGHRDLGHSVCPGRNLYSHVKQLRG